MTNDNTTIQAAVTTAVALSQEQKTAIESTLAKKFAPRQVKCIYQVDAQVIGGIKLEVDSVEYNSTVLYKLQKVKDQLKQKVTTT